MQQQAYKAGVKNIPVFTHVPLLISRQKYHFDDIESRKEYI